MTAEYNGFLASIIDENHYYLPIKQVYEDWRKDQDTRKMLNNAYHFLDAAAKDITYCFAFADSHGPIKEDFNKQKSVFLNPGTETLFNLYRKWAVSEEEIDFDEGLDAIGAFMATCFGIRFHDGTSGEKFTLVAF